MVYHLNGDGQKVGRGPHLARNRALMIAEYAAHYLGRTHHLVRDIEARQDVVDVAAGHGQIDVSSLEKRVSETEDASPLGERNGPESGHVEVAADELGAKGRSGHQRRTHSLFAARRPCNDLQPVRL